jgi:AraC-like DNA-binding protein
MGEPRADGAGALPAPALRPFVERYQGYRLADFPPGIHRGLPSRHLTLIASIGPAIDVVAQTDPRQPPATYRCVVGGLQASTALIAHDGNQEGVTVELTPLGCRAVLGAPSGALWDTSLELDELTGAVGRELWERLQGTVTWRERFAVCDDVLLRLLEPTTVAPELGWCWRTVVATDGRVTVRELADETGWSRQHLTRRFRAEFGLSPKVAARVVRFDRARRMLQHAPPGFAIADVAAACGYFDHAHLDRDFADLAGCTPTELLTDDLPSVQDDDLLEAAGSGP